MLTLREDVPYFEHDRNVVLANDDVELVLPTEFGPRIMRYALHGGDNVLSEISPRAQKKSTSYGDDWHIYGGHRLWYAPEHEERSYYPDNRPVRLARTPDGLHLTQEVESHTGIEKHLVVELATRGSHVTVRHRLENRGQTTHELAPWALSAMAPGGRAIFPHPAFRPHPDALAPARPLVLWPFTRMSDPRWHWGDRFFTLRQDRARTDPQKVGFYDPLGYMAYALGDVLFLKCHTPRRGAHADFGCNGETFTNELFLEIETLGPLGTLAPGDSVEHLEHWFLFPSVNIGTSDDEIERALAPCLAEAEAVLRG